MQPSPRPHSRTFTSALKEALSICGHFLFLTTPSSWQTPICFLSLLTWACWLFQINGITRCAAFGVWLLSFTQGSVCALQESISPVPCKFWWLCGGVKGDLFLQEGLCRTQVYCTQSPCPCSRLLLTCTSSETLKHCSVSVSVGSLDPGAQD